MISCTEHILKLTKTGPERYRATLPKMDGDTPPEAVTLVEACWAEDPLSRPTFEMLKEMVRGLNKDR